MISDPKWTSNQEASIFSFSGVRAAQQLALSLFHWLASLPFSSSLRPLACRATFLPSLALGFFSRRNFAFAKLAILEPMFSVLPSATSRIDRSNRTSAEMCCVVLPLPLPPPPPLLLALTLLLLLALRLSAFLCFAPASALLSVRERVFVRAVERCLLLLAPRVCLCTLCYE